jgi:tetratricopeptide (TPR) repeat protein
MLSCGLLMGRLLAFCNDRSWPLALALATATLVTYAPVEDSGFVAYDDTDIYIGDPHVHQGLSRASLAWAFSTGHSYWHPLTWISHMLDCELFGQEPAGHHRTSLFIHTASAVLLFLTLRSLTGAPWSSALVAALFALHPLNVESVAWVSERKSVLSAFFSILAIAAYGGYARRPGLARYLVVAAAVLAALLSKPMAVTLPLVLLLLDLWPLARLGRVSPGRLALEKLPLLALSVLASVLTIESQREMGALIPVDSVGLPARVANALVSYVLYAFKMVWPARLAAFYPQRELGPAVVAGAAALLLGTTAVVAWRARREPYLAVGWLWYLGTLVPVIGIVQVGSQAMADRYAYVPLIGLFVAIAWVGASLLSRRPAARPAAGAVALAILLALAVRTRQQVGVWHDSLSLFSSSVRAVPDSWVAHYNLGEALTGSGRFAEAEAEYRETIRLQPRFARAHNNLGMALDSQGHTEEAIAAYAQAVHLKPDLAEAYNNLGVDYASLGRYTEGVAALREALRLRPDFAQARHNLDVALRRMAAQK